MQDDARPLTEEEKLVHLLDRFTPGATPESLEQARVLGVREWIETQLRASQVEPEDLVSRLKPLEAVGKDVPEILAEYDKPIPDDLPEAEKEERRKRQAIPARQLVHSVLLRAVYSPNGLREVACDFFRNHFAVSVEKDEVRFTALAWEREVIRRHALGSFPALLEASAKHAAMLVFLDNHLSRRPPTPSELRMIETEARQRTKSRERGREAADIARQRGLNENYARELLELHTLGVDNGYRQEDVIAVAKCLTGWTVKRGEAPRGLFAFNPEMHSTERKTVLGVEIRVKRDEPTEGEQVLQLLSSHPGTARFLAWKLCRWLVNDEPDEEMVKRVARVHARSQGDLAKVLRAIAEDPAFFERRNFRAKYKRPFEYVVSALRATRAEISAPEGLDHWLVTMNEPLYRCADPTGYYDQAEAWRDPGSMAARWAFAEALVHGRVAGVRIPASLYADLPAGELRAWRGRLAARLLPGTGLGEATASRLDATIERERLKAPRLGPAIVAAILGSPEFQKQ